VGNYSRIIYGRIIFLEKSDGLWIVEKRNYWRVVIDL